MNNWENVRFENAPLEIIDGDRGVNYPKQSDFTTSGYCLFLNTGNVTEIGFNFSDCSFISEAKDNKLRKGKLTRYDIVLTTRGTVGNLSFYDDRVPFENIRINSGMVIIRADTEKIFPRYLYFLLKSSVFKKQVSAFATGSAQPQLPIRDINRIEFPLPPLPEQRAIAGILGALDDKIELNRRMNATLESMAREVFRQWFVENEEVESWEVGKFNDISDISREAITPNQFPDETFNHYSIPAFDEKRFPEKEFGIEIKSNKFLVPNACVLISKLNPETRRIWIPFQIEGRSVCSTEFLVNIPKSYFSLEYLYGLFSSQPFQDRFTSMITGTSGSHQRVKAEYLLDMETQIPPKKLVMEYAETVKPLLQKVQQKILESRTLASLRDSLLPKLMRGEVRIKD